MTLKSGFNVLQPKYDCFQHFGLLLKIYESNENFSDSDIIMWS